MGEAKATIGRVTQGWVLIDVGNTNVKTGWTIDGELKSVQQSPVNLPPEQFLHGIQSGASQAAIASVNPAALEAITKNAGSIGLDVRVVLTSDGAIFRSGVVTTDVTSPETTGVDRVLGCLGAHLKASDGSVVVVDCGTATTVNVMTADKCFRGGMIAPGRRLLAQSLRQGTASLPEIIPDAVRIEVGKTTQDCLNAGVTAAFVGNIRECVAAAKLVFPSARVFLTGGDAETAHRFFPEFHRVNWLTLIGLHWYASNVGRMS